MAGRPGSGGRIARWIARSAAVGSATAWRGRPVPRVAVGARLAGSRRERQDSPDRCRRADHRRCRCSRGWSLLAPSSRCPARPRSRRARPSGRREDRRAEFDPGWPAQHSSQRSSRPVGCRSAGSPSLTSTAGLLRMALMIVRRPGVPLAVAILAMGVLTGCAADASAEDERPSLVASFYPLAFVA